MATKIPNLWSQKDVKVEVLSPFAILRTQAANLEQMTKGLIEAEITATATATGEIFYQLDLIAPVLGGYRHRLFAISHKKDMLYPVRFLLSSTQISELIKRLGPQNWTEVAGTEAIFLNELTYLLQSNDVNAVIQSIIARSNEVQSAQQEDEAAVKAVA